MRLGCKIKFIGGFMEVPKNIKSKINRILKLRSEARELENIVYDWLNENDIDTDSDRWQDGMSPRLSYSEFKDAYEFEEDLNKFLDGEIVGHG